MTNPYSYYTVQRWMRDELGLKGNALTVYAIIYGFSQDGASEYSGSARYLSDWLGCSRSTVMEVLKNLVERGLLTKRDIYKNGITYCTYQAVYIGCPNTGQGVQNSDRGVSENQTGGVQNSDRGCPNPGHNNTRDIDRDNNRDIEKEIDKEKNMDAPAAPDAPPPPVKEEKGPVKHHHGEYKKVMLTDEELAKLKEEFPTDWAERIARLDEYIASKGAKYKSHYATIRAWAKRDKQQAPAPATRGRPRSGTVGPNGVAYDPSKTDLDKYF